MRNWLSSLVRQIASVVWHVSWHVLVLALWIFPWFWDGKHYFWLARHVWAPGMLVIGSSPATIVGGDRVDWTKPHIIVANHQGNADIPLLFVTVRAPLRFLAKRSVGHIPFVGWLMRLARFPFIERENARAARDSLSRVAERIRRESLNVVVFPEGTRSPEGTILPFKLGAFMLAIEAQVPIVPIALRGSGIALPRASFRIFPHPLEATVGEPIPTEGLDLSARTELAQRAQDAIQKMLGWRKIAPSELGAARREDREARLRSVA
jgi:1-acyl-sn-glycerol-3-phosphate acyltransferase